ncbi:MAG TPA: alpha/beta fold hydrolase [Acidimicrobiales bacterium]|nr:alpha/beta fold hydrolase [Acidimicrobiales bacterium]
MTVTQATFRGPVDVGDVELWVEQRGEGPDVLLIAGLGDPIEAWQFQLDALSDRYRVTAFDNRGMGRSPLPEEPYKVRTMADDAAAILRALGVPAAHVTGFSGGSVIAQELALNHPELVRSLVLDSTWARFDPFIYTLLESVRWLLDAAPSERAFLEAFYLWIYTRRAHADGTVAAIIEDALTFPHKPSAEAVRRQIDAYVAHEGTADRLQHVAVPTLVIAGGQDIMTPPHLGRVVAEGIPGARFVVLEEEAHQPFQERPEQFNALVDEFWRTVDGRT